MNSIFRYLDPIFFGEYPKSMQERLGDKLPVFSQKDKALLRNSLDFVGLNHYTSRFVSHLTNKEQNDYYRGQEATRIGTLLTLPNICVYCVHNYIYTHTYIHVCVCVYKGWATLLVRTNLHKSFFTFNFFFSFLPYINFNKHLNQGSLWEKSLYLMGWR